MSSRVNRRLDGTLALGRIGNVRRIVGRKVAVQLQVLALEHHIARHGPGIRGLASGLPGAHRVLIERRSAGSAEQRRIDAADDVMTAAAPGERQVDQRKAAGAQREADRDAVREVADPEPLRRPA